MAERTKSRLLGRPLTRQISFQLHDQSDDKQPEQNPRLQCDTNVELVRKPIVRKCSFQRKYKKEDKHTNHYTTPPQVENRSNKKSLAELLPELMGKLKIELECKTFIVKAKSAVERRKRMEHLEPIEYEKRKWINGNEIQAFYHTWQTSADHIKDQRVRPRTVQRMNTLPMGFRMPDNAVDKTTQNAKKQSISSGFGIVRECCSNPRMRLPTFLSHHD